MEQTEKNHRRDDFWDFFFFQVARALNYYFEHINVIERLVRDERGREGASDAADLDRSPSGMCV